MSRPSPEIHPPLRHPRVPLRLAQASAPLRLLCLLGRRAQHQECPQPLARDLRGRDLARQLQSPVRIINVVKLRVIGAANQVLVESHQQLSDGSIHHRCLLLSEKMKPSEMPKMAVIRAVREELGSAIRVEVGNTRDVVRIVPGSYMKSRWEVFNFLSGIAGALHIPLVRGGGRGTAGGRRVLHGGGRGV
ncbi:hypothetical protein NL676_028599 [Syzygium grande]|nr:hypothetical protein NL676_028599 [Syzygium grande]